MRSGIILAILCGVLGGCATLRTAKPVSFADAVRSSLEQSGKYTYVVVHVDADGTIRVAGRPTTLAELSTLPYVEGLTAEEKPAVIIQAPPDAKHADVRAVMDACSKAGIWRIAFRGLKKETQAQNKPPEATR